MLLRPVAVHPCIENLSLFIEKHCKIVVDSIPCRVRDTAHMLDIIDELNIEGVQDQDLLVSFDITNMFPHPSTIRRGWNVSDVNSMNKPVILIYKSNALSRHWKFA